MSQLLPILVGVFNTKEDADKAFMSAVELGYAENEINVIMSEEAMQKYYYSLLNFDKPPSVTAGIMGGSALGGTLGGILGTLFMLGANLVTPGIGLVIAGPLAGVITGTLMGSLLSLGITESKAQEYDEKINQGAIVLTLKQRFPSALAEIWRDLEHT